MAGDNRAIVRDKYKDGWRLALDCFGAARMKRNVDAHTIAREGISSWRSELWICRVTGSMAFFKITCGSDLPRELNA